MLHLYGLVLSVISAHTGAAAEQSKPKPRKRWQSSTETGGDTKISSDISSSDIVKVPMQPGSDQFFKAVDTRMQELLDAQLRDLGTLIITVCLS